MEEDQSKKTILVVDDQNDNLVLVSLAMQDKGFRVVTASNGEEAVATAKLAAPDLILMDIAMPHLDGLEATRLIRIEAGLENTPIIALTAFDTEGFRKAAHNAGFSGYLTKPIDFERLFNLIEMLLPLRRETTSLSPLDAPLASRDED